MRYTNTEICSYVQRHAKSGEKPINENIKYGWY